MSGSSQADAHKTLGVQDAYWGSTSVKERSREQVWAEGEVRQWCEPGKASGARQSEYPIRVSLQWAGMSESLYPTSLRLWMQAAPGMV